MQREPLNALREARPQRKLKKGALEFEGGEHAWLGNAGVILACEQLRAAGHSVYAEDFHALKRLHGAETFQYGELVALSGDFYETPADLYEERPSPVPWLWEKNDLSDIKALFGKELKWIAERQAGKGLEAYPDANIRMAWNAKGYIELALRNNTHFGWHNQVAYCRHHGSALALAASAKGKSDDRWARAVVYNAFANHFLTDGFAAGHVRTPRGEIRTWAASRGMSEKLAGALSKLLHDQDGHVGTLHGGGAGKGSTEQRTSADGLAVKNSRGETWRTFCDAQLFLFGGKAVPRNPEVYQPSQAVADSFRELYLAWQTGKLPKTYSAIERVPFPDPAEPGLAAKFQALATPAKLKALHRSVAWYGKVPWIGPGLKAAHIAQLFAALPALLGRFRDNVARDLKNDPSLGVLMPRKYIDAYRTLK